MSSRSKRSGAISIEDFLVLTDCSVVEEAVTTSNTER
jgi:hypothetical protein